jgi:hypothetical protein
LAGPKPKVGCDEPTAGRQYFAFHSTVFPTDGGWNGDDPDPERPAGREVIESLSRAVDACLPLDAIWNEEGYGWSFNCKVEKVTVNVLVQYIDHWLVIVHEVSLRPRFLRGSAYAGAVLEICRRVHGVVAVLPHVSGAKWYTADEYESQERQAASRRRITTR